MNPKDKSLNLLGLAYRAKKLVSGTDTVMTEIRKRNLSLVILSKDASGNTKKQFLNKCDFYNIPIVVKFSSAEISHAIGRERMVCAFSDDGFAKSFRNCLREMER